MASLSSILHRSCAFCISLAAIIASPATSQAYDQADLDWCRNEGKHFLADVQIAGCARVIETTDPADEVVETAFLNRAIAYYSIGDHGRTIADLDQIIERNANHLPAHYYRGAVRYNAGDYEGSIADYSEAIRLNPEYADAYFFRGVAYQRKGEYERAIADYDAAIRLNPGRAISSFAYLNRGNLYAALGEYGKALADLAIATELDPDFDEAHDRRAWLLATAPEQSLRDGTQAVSSALTAVALAPQNAKYHETLAAAYAEEGNFSTAVEVQQKAISLASEGGSIAEDALRQRLELYLQSKPYRARTRWLWVSRFLSR